MALVIIHGSTVLIFVLLIVFLSIPTLSRNRREVEKYEMLGIETIVRRLNKEFKYSLCSFYLNLFVLVSNTILFGISLQEILRSKL